MEFFNIKKEEAPTCRLINLEEDMRKFVPEFTELKADNIVPWVEAYLRGEVEVSAVAARGGGGSGCVGVVCSNWVWVCMLKCVWVWVGVGVGVGVCVQSWK